MPTCRLLCLLAFPLLAVSASDDLVDEYLTQSKRSQPDLVARQVLPPDGIRRTGRLIMPRMWAVMLDRLSTDQDRGLEDRGLEDRDQDPRTKRVFCNGFTGCGGRFRGRRRQAPVLLLKRPVYQTPSKAMAQQIMRLPHDIRKRLFCNAYSGCRGKKRALYSNWLNKLQGIVGDL